ncbi:YHS domain-containing protein [Seminavis robusta]|uniref:YHS domain-containing protein n=1 Tax=Seminavis robusta TaxID=568900 RepID=A0A9N8H432_9STRA|nr:YHS domain-containing protein [Seminavis robusta]|eukprot:Sro75_g041230.1 YHS domain-containing protein (677) ;mRNA; f:61906-63936
MMKLAVVLALLSFLPAVHGQGGAVNDPILAGYDLVAYHSLDSLDDGVPGSPDFQTRHKGYLYYFSSQDNLDIFLANPEPYLPAYGGFCAWGVAWEYEDDGWPWAADHMGPPCGPRDGWALLTDESTGQRRLYCSIWRSYQDDFNRRQEEGIRLANQRWVEWYGSLDAGPMNHGCYAWNWQSCFAESIYDPSNPVTEAADPTATPTMAPTQSHTLFEPGQASGLTTVWSDPMAALGGVLSFQWTLEDVDSIRPLLIVDLLYEMDEEELPLASGDNFYLGFGVAEQVMEGALVVCAPTTGGATTVAKSSGLDGAGSGTGSSCKTYLGSGMGITAPNSDPVQPTVLESERNETHYRVRFSANLFACWSNPVWPARVLFSRGLVSGNGDPMPHLNNPLHRQAVKGVEFLSVIRGDNGMAANATTDGPPPPLELDPLPSDVIVNVGGTLGSLVLLNGRVTLNYGLYRYSNQDEEVVHIKLLNVPYNPLDDEDEEHTYIGFGFATDTMSGLVMTCMPSSQIDNDGNTTELFATCHQWRGLGTNLYPRALETDAGGWFLTNLEGNGTHLNYTLAGRVADVLDEAETVEGRIDSDSNLRAIVAVGRAAPDTGTPLMHTSRDRTPLVLDKLAVMAQGSVSQLKAGDSGSSAASSHASSSSGTAVPTFQCLSLVMGLVASFLISAV